MHSAGIWSENKGKTVRLYICVCNIWEKNSDYVFILFYD